MSPEQARGKTVDKRTDIWAYGCVLYEMLTGRRAFAGETASDTIATILEREPDWTKLPAAAPAHVRRLLRRCLQKDSNRRLRDIGDARLELDEALSSPQQADLQKPAVITRRTAISALAGAAAGAATGVFVIRSYRASPRNLTRFAIPTPEGEFLSASFNDRVAISPDGMRIAFNTGTGSTPNFYTRSLSELESKVLGAEYQRYWNQERLHSGIGYKTPAQFAAELGPDSATLRPPQVRSQNQPTLISTGT